MILKKSPSIIFATAFLFAVLTPIVCSAQSNDAKPATPLAQVDAKMVDRIDVLLIDEQTSFQTAVTQEVIERVYDVKYSVRNEHARALITLINAQIAKAIEAKSGQNYDFRYAVIIYDDKGNRLLSLYIDNFGNSLLGTKDVQFDPSFKKLLRNWRPSTNTLDIPNAPAAPFKYPPPRP